MTRDGRGKTARGVSLFLEEAFRRMDVLDVDDERWQELKGHQFVGRLLRFEGRWLMYHIHNERVVLANVTPLVARQIALVRLSFYFLLMSCSLSH